MEKEKSRAMKSYTLRVLRKSTHEEDCKEIKYIITDSVNSNSLKYGDLIYTGDVVHFVIEQADNLIKTAYKVGSGEYVVRLPNVACRELVLFETDPEFPQGNSFYISREEVEEAIKSFDPHEGAIRKYKNKVREMYTKDSNLRAHKEISYEQGYKDALNMCLGKSAEIIHFPELTYVVSYVLDEVRHNMYTCAMYDFDLLYKTIDDARAFYKKEHLKRDNPDEEDYYHRIWSVTYDFGKKLLIDEELF